jgi:hypothetical protein
LKELPGVDLDEALAACPSRSRHPNVKGSNSG